jgi:hypothetical protein
LFTVPVSRLLTPAVSTKLPPFQRPPVSVKLFPYAELLHGVEFGGRINIRTGPEFVDGAVIVPPVTLKLQKT